MGNRGTFHVSHPRSTLRSDNFNNGTDNWLLVMSSQLIGFSIGGIARRFLVAPPSMSSVPFPWIDRPSLDALSASVWPNTLVLCALFNTLHSQTYVGIGQHDGISRERYFIYAFGAAALWCEFIDIFRPVSESERLSPRFHSRIFLPGVEVFIQLAFQDKMFIRVGFLPCSVFSWVNSPSTRALRSTSRLALAGMLGSPR